MVALGGGVDRDPDLVRGRATPGGFERERDLVAPCAQLRLQGQVAVAVDAASPQLAVPAGGPGDGQLFDGAHGADLAFEAVLALGLQQGAVLRLEDRRPAVQGGERDRDQGLEGIVGSDLQLPLHGRQRLAGDRQLQLVLGLNDAAVDAGGQREGAVAVVGQGGAQYLQRGVAAVAQRQGPLLFVPRDGKSQAAGLHLQRGPGRGGGQGHGQLGGVSVRGENLQLAGLGVEALRRVRHRDLSCRAGGQLALVALDLERPIRPDALDLGRRVAAVAQLRLRADRVSVGHAFEEQLPGRDGQQGLVALQGVVLAAQQPEKRNSAHGSLPPRVTLQLSTGWRLPSGTHRLARGNLW